MLLIYKAKKIVAKSQHIARKHRAKRDRRIKFYLLRLEHIPAVKNIKSTKGLSTWEIIGEGFHKNSFVFPKGDKLKEFYTIVMREGKLLHTIGQYKFYYLSNVLKRKTALRTMICDIVPGFFNEVWHLIPVPKHMV